MSHPHPRYDRSSLHHPRARLQEKLRRWTLPPQKLKTLKRGLWEVNYAVDPDKYPMAWMHDCQCWYDEEMINFWPLLHLLMDGKGAMTQHLACRLLSMWHWSSITHPTSCLSSPNQHGNWVMVAIGPRGK